MQYILIGLFGSLGVLSRHSIGQLISSQNQFLNPTLLSNLLGCILFGYFLSLFGEQQVKSHWNEILLIGFCGGLTTFSSFMFQLFNLVKENKYMELFLTSTLTVFAGIFLIYIGTLIYKISK